MTRDGAFQLHGCVFGMLKPPLRHRRRRMRPQVDVGVTQQRQNRVVERRRGHLDLAADDTVAVFRNHSVQQLEFDGPKQLFVVLGKPAVLGHQPANPRIPVQIKRVHPGQLVPHLQVAEIVDGERQSASPLVEQFLVPGIDLDHPLALRMEEVLEDEDDVRLGEIGSGCEAQIEDTIACAICRKCLELDEQRRHQVERDADARKLPKERRHPVVVLQRVHPHPGEDVLAGDEILVVRLMHVPEDGHACHTL